MLIAAIVVVYNAPMIQILDHIGSYYNDVSLVCIVDNSDSVYNDSHELCSQYNKIMYCTMGGNKGIAYALNYGMAECIKRGYKWVLTLDQDSRFISSLKPFLLNIPTSLSAILYPVYDISGYRIVSPNKRVLQSGSLLNVDCYQKIGGFEERYFIDYVDYDYCARLLKEQFEITCIPDIILSHTPGNHLQGSCCGVKYNYISVAPVRYYYIARNGIDYIFHHRDWAQFIPYLKAILKIFFQEKKKRERLIYFALGIKDCFRSNWGVYKKV